MKASDVKEVGYYWYRSPKDIDPKEIKFPFTWFGTLDGGEEIVEIVKDFHGLFKVYPFENQTSDPYDLDYVLGDFVGPIKSLKEEDWN